jgi:hypothetical protein
MLPLNGRTIALSKSSKSSHFPSTYFWQKQASQVNQKHVLKFNLCFNFLYRLNPRGG